MWTANGDGTPSITLSEEQWGLVQTLELNLFYDDGEGYIDLGLDAVYEFDDDGALLGDSGSSWLAIEGQPVHIADGQLLRYSQRLPQQVAVLILSAVAVVVAQELQGIAGLQTLDLNLFYDDGAGYIDMGLDNVYDFDDTGALLGVNDGTWLAIDGQTVAYYHTSTVDDGENYTITGRVPVLHNSRWCGRWYSSTFSVLSAPYPIAPSLREWGASPWPGRSF